MFQGWVIVALAVAYIGALFLIAAIGDRLYRRTDQSSDRPFVYSLSLAVYCTSWTFFGSVGVAATTGYDFVPVYIGPILMFTLGLPIVLRIVRIAKSQNLTSVADFLAARYGKSQAVATVATLILALGTLPYVALQLKAVVISLSILLSPSPLVPLATTQLGPIDTALVVAIVLAVFTILFGTRHIDATEHQNGLMLAIATESVIKLVAFLAVGIWATIAVFDDFAGLAERARASPHIQSIFGRPFHGGTWLTVIILSACCILLLPRQFHVAVVENTSEREIRRAAWLFPFYLVAINLLVVPIAAAGLETFPRELVEPDLYVMALPMLKEAHGIALIAFVGGLSAAAAMVIVESIALAIMVGNGLVIPLLIRYRLVDAESKEELAGTLLFIRRIAILAVILSGYWVYRQLGEAYQLAALGLLSFAAVAQLAPAFFGGLIWRKGTAKGAIAGLIVGFLLWGYTLILPWAGKAGLVAMSIITDGPFGLAILKPQALLYMHFEPLTHGVVFSLLANTLTYVAVSLLRAPVPIERLQAQMFVQDDLPRPAGQPAFRIWRTSITTGDLQTTVGRYLGVERAERSFQEFAAGRGIQLRHDVEADIHTLRFTEHLLTSAIGAASSRLVLSLLLRRGNVGGQAALKLLDDASEALQYNRDLLQSALDQVRHGLGVFDRDMRLICWNRQFRELLALPPELGRVGMPLDRILRTLAVRGDLGRGDVDTQVADRLVRLAIQRETMQERIAESGRTLEIRTSAIPQGGIVITYLDITDRVAAADSLARANETLEGRVKERTAELLEVNTALAIAKNKADEANLDKTRFLAAASHDILQPLNAARLYAASLAERALPSEEKGLARNIDASLEAVEEILSSLIDMSRIDAGRLEPEVSSWPLADLFDQLRVEFLPAAAAKGLRLSFVRTSTWVRTDRRLARRVLQNLVSNAIKYTARGGVVVGARRRQGSVAVAVYDTGPGIPEDKQALVFKEFQRLDDTASAARGLGLGLSIVERIGRVLAAPIGLISRVGSGSTFSIALPLTAPEGAAVASPAPERPQRLLKPLAGIVTLCVENEPAVLAGMVTLLEGWGCEVLQASGKAEALLVARTATKPPDALLADYHLDDGTGLETALALREMLGAELPVIVITADHTPEVQRHLRDNACSLLRKPIRAGALRSLLTQQVLRRSVAAE
jgi:Na+/proline symporter/signal transduction histidine kinase/CheY-like chemotaxis protein